VPRCVEEEEEEEEEEAVAAGAWCRGWWTGEEECGGRWVGEM
jgi:hypothetical protein